jgi:membrane-associated PAP2 superfamily phosphatase
MWVLVYLLLGIAAATTVISLVGPNVDLAIASLFYDPATRRFIGESNHYVAMLRDHGMIGVVTCIGSIGLALTSFLPWRLPSVRPRTALFLTISLLLGPGLLVNGILKPHGDVRVQSKSPNSTVPWLLSIGGIRLAPVTAIAHSFPARRRPRR